MITPPFLSPGDTIAIVATARKISKVELEPALQLLNDWGVKVYLGKTIGAAANQFAGNDLLRAEDFQEALDNSEIKAIWCARGGYGSVRMIDSLDFSAFKKNPKWIIGYSDITVLHSHVHNFGIATLHAQMPLEIEKKTQATRTSIKSILFGEQHKIEYNSENLLNRTGNVKGQLIGGNLSLLYSLIGSASHIDTNGKILFIEDLDEYLYHIDRMLQNLKRSGMLKGLKGMIVGGMSDMNDNTIPFGKTATEIIKETVSEYNFPLCFDFPAGHVLDNQALILGREVELNITHKTTTLIF
jgi:muramoyltetrapeptide carboxypeptidase